MAATLLLPPITAFWLVHLALRNAGDRIVKWLVSARRLSILMLIAVPAWWSLSTAFTKLDTWIPGWTLLLIPLSISLLLARLISYWSNAKVFSRGWRGGDIFRLALWRTLSSTIPLLLTAIGIDAILAHHPIGILCLFGAGPIALIGSVQLRSAEGIKFRPVKSGSFYKRSLQLSKKMGVTLERISVVPFGRGRLTNAYGSSIGIAVTDDYGHWLHGPQLDFVIGHELAHVKQKHALKKLLVVVSMFASIAMMTFAMPPLPMEWKVIFNFTVILTPILALNKLSRHFEYVADCASVELTQDGNTAIRTLIGMYRHAEVPAKISAFDELFETHPALWHRIDALASKRLVEPEQVLKMRKEYGEEVGTPNDP